MKRTHTFSLHTVLATALAAMAISVAGCDDTSDSLTGGASRGPSRSPATTNDDTPGAHEGTEGMSEPGSGEDVTPASVRVVGSPEVTSRLHGCGKMSVTSLRDLLQSRGLTGGGDRPQNTQSGQDIFNNGDSAAALGAANYPGRVPEAPFSSTSAVAKMFDIFTMAAYDAAAEDWSAPACPGVKVIDGGKFTKDGLTCLIGKPASDAHVAIANDAISKNPTDGAKIAIAALLAAAHTCQ